MYVLRVNPITSAKWDGSTVPKNVDDSGRNSSDAAATENHPVQRVPTQTIEEQ